MANRNGTVLLALCAFVAALAIAAGGQSARANWGNGHSAGPDVPSPYPTTYGETWDWNYTSDEASKPAGQGHELLTRTTGTVAETYDCCNFYASTLTYATSQQNSKVVIFGTTATDDDVTYTGCGTGKTCFDVYEETGTGSSNNSNGGSSSNAFETFYNVGGFHVWDMLSSSTGAELGKNTTWNNAVGYEFESTSSTTDVHGNITDMATLVLRAQSGAQTTENVTTTIFGSTTVESAQSTSGYSTKKVTGGNNPGSTTFGAPIQQNGLMVIPVTTGSGTVFVPDWYPGGGAPPPLWTDQGTDLGQTTVPKNCGVDAGDPAERLAEKTTFLDIVGGTYSFGVENRYVVQNQGVVCIVRTRTLDSYDNMVTGAQTNQTRFYTLQSLTSFTPAKINHGHHSFQPIRGFTVH